MITPLYDRVLVEKEEADQTTESGLYLPTNDANQAVYGRVIALGQGYRQVDADGFRQLVVQEGHRVLFRTRSATEIKEGGKTYYLLREQDLLGFEDAEGESYPESRL